jgi:hypothetical protein
MWLLMLTLEGKGRRFSLPIPLLLFWPLVLPAGLLAIAIALARTPRLAWVVMRFVLACLFRLGGMEVRLKSRNGERVLVRFI